MQKQRRIAASCKVDQALLEQAIEAASKMIEEAGEIVDAAHYLANHAGVQIQSAWLEPDAGAADLAAVLARLDQRGNGLADKLTDEVLQGVRDPEIALPIVQELCQQAADLQLGATLYRQTGDGNVGSD